MKPAMAKRSFCCISTTSWGVLRWSNGSRRLLAVFSVMLGMVLFLPCDGKDRVDGVLNSLLYGGCEIFGDSDNSIETTEGLPSYLELKNVCFESTSLCFPSTLIGLSSDFDGFHSESWEFDSVNLRSCKGSPSPDTWNHDSVGFSYESLLSDYVEINPPILDWGINNLFTPSLVNLTIINMHNTSVLHVFEPFTSDQQFYTYGFERLSLAPGEACSIGLIFVPNRLGLVLFHVVLETSFGGFIIHAKGMAIESPYKVKPFRGFEHLSDGRLKWNLSLYNSFDNPLYVEEVTARVSIESENTSYTSSVTCSHLGSLCKSGDSEIPGMEIRPHHHWELPPLSAETVVILNLWPPVKGNISGILCIKLKNFTEDTFETVVVPFDAEVNSRATYNSLSGSVSVFFESLVGWNERGFVCSLSLRNSAPYLLRVVNITEKLNVFKVKYREGLLLYPDSITQVALIAYDFPDVSEDNAPKFPWMSTDCKVTLVTNDSISPEIIIPCEDIGRMCYAHELGVGFVKGEGSFIILKSEEEKLTNARTGSLESLDEKSLQLKSNVLQLLEADRLLLRNWRSHGTMSKLSVLKDHELLFPLVQIGTEFSKWVTVQNPSSKPIIVQLVLNSGSIINHCKYPDDSLIYIETNVGFSLPDTVTTEAIVNPFGSAQIGPILFRPSKQCTWRSSALIRNNLSGVEWFSLRASGGCHSLLLLDGSKPVKKLDFFFYSPTILNLSSPNSSLHLKTTSNSCVPQLFKELHAKNVGEDTLEVMRLEVSGTDCGLDGFLVHNCRGFSLAPGESKRLLISYQVDFSVSLVQRDLKVAMATGFLVIPMEATLPINLMDFCRSSLFWAVIWKLLVLVVTVLFVAFLFFVLLHPIPSGAKEYSVKSEKTIATISRVEKTSHAHRNTKNTRSTKKNERLEEALLINRHPCSENILQENTQRVLKEMKDSDHQEKTTLQSPQPKLPVGEVDGLNALDSSQSGNLSVKIKKEKGRRRKRRLATKFEVSSSHSGNSTPSSPVSPSASTPNSSFSSPGAITEERHHENKQTFSFAKESRVAQPQKNSGRPILLSSATFPGSGARAPVVASSNILASASPIAPDARAPGSKRSKEKAMKIEEDGAFRQEYTYDIWGNHFCGHLMGKPKEVSSIRVFDASEGDSQSFFTRDPQSLMMMSSPPNSENSGHKLTPYDVDYLKQIK